MAAPGPGANGSVRAIPLTYNRAATAVVRSRSLLEKARQEAHMALEILSTMDPHDAEAPPDVLAMMRLIVEYLDRLSIVDPPKWSDGLAGDPGRADPREEES